jgi:hypothetical protein
LFYDDSRGDDAKVPFGDFVKRDARCKTQPEKTLLEVLHSLPQVGQLMLKALFAKYLTIN